MTAPLPDPLVPGEVEENRPAPLVPAEVNLQDFKFMPLDVVRLRDSGLVSDFESDEALAAILLWSASWHQVPASSLPDSDKQLAKLAGYGKGVRDYLKIKNCSLHRFIKCADGRWYHPVVAEKAAEGWNAKIEEAHKRACDRQRKANKERKERHEPELPMPTKPPLLSNIPVNGIPRWRYFDSAGSELRADGILCYSAGNSRLKRSEGTEKGQGQGCSTPTGTPRGASDPIFSPYLELLESKGISQGHARNFLSLMRQGYGDELVLSVLHDAKKDDVTKPVPWIQAALKKRSKPAALGNKQEDLEDRNRKAVQDWRPPEMRDAT